MPDPKYNSVLVAKFIRSVMHDGKKSTAEKLLYEAFEIIEKKTSEPPLKVFEKALDNVKPMTEVKSRRVGGSTYQVPTEVRPARRQALGIRWMIDFARKRGERGMAARLAGQQGVCPFPMVIRLAIWKLVHVDDLLIDPIRRNSR